MFKLRKELSMQHIINIAFDFDDDAIKAKAESAISNGVDNIIHDIVFDHLAPPEVNYWGKPTKDNRDWAFVDKVVRNVVSEIVDSRSEEIMNRAAKMLFDSTRRTKVWKERYMDIVENDVESDEIN